MDMRLQLGAAIRTILGRPVELDNLQDVERRRRGTLLIRLAHGLQQRQHGSCRGTLPCRRL
jgi:hypothetical protein